MALTSLKSIVATLFLFAILLSPMLMLPSEAGRPNRELNVRAPIIFCPACVCCAPPPSPNTCCPCRCSTPGGPISAEVENQSP
ncbi:hypothetical protein ACH5RR_025824 [Cinchona calisaya]|uniref:Transmembrane protein n=1 Tax=Cinchona calisaya TaxID=153742 RepID=A0ABD2Z4S5_9GENT